MMVSQSRGADTLISACFDSAAAAVRGQIVFTTDPLFQTGKAAANELAIVCSHRVWKWQTAPTGLVLRFGQL